MLAEVIVCRFVLDRFMRYIDGLVQGGIISIAKALEIQQSRTKPSIFRCSIAIQACKL